MLYADEVPGAKLRERVSKDRKREGDEMLQSLSEHGADKPALAIGELPATMLRLACGAETARALRTIRRDRKGDPGHAVSGRERYGRIGEHAHNCRIGALDLRDFNRPGGFYASGGKGARRYRARILLGLKGMCGP